MVATSKEGAGVALVVGIGVGDDGAARAGVVCASSIGQARAINAAVIRRIVGVRHSARFVMATIRPSIRSRIIQTVGFSCPFGAIHARCPHSSHLCLTRQQRRGLRGRCLQSSVGTRPSRRGCAPAGCPPRSASASGSWATSPARARVPHSSSLGLPRSATTGLRWLFPDKIEIPLWKWSRKNSSLFSRLRTRSTATGRASPPASASLPVIR